MTDYKILASFKKKLIDKSLEITTGIISISAVSYVLSRIFIKYYLEIINFDRLGYSALSNNDTSSLFFFGILMISLALVILSALVPACLRQIYFEYETSSDRVNVKTINFLIIISFLVVFVVSLIIIFYIQSAWILLLIGIFPIVIFSYKYINTKDILTPEKPLLNQVSDSFNTDLDLRNLKFYKNINKKYYLTKSIFLGCLFALCMTLLIAPCLLLILFVNQSTFVRDIHNSNITVIIISALVWILYSGLYGSRITEPSKKHYIYDIIFSFAIIYFLAIINLSTFVISIAQFVGIKDNKAYLYKINNQKYADFSKDLNIFWQDNYTNFSSTKICQPLSKTINEHTYLQAQIIFRDSDIAIVCPPNISLVKDGTEQCFITSRVDLIATSKTMKILLHK